MTALALESESFSQEICEILARQTGKQASEIRPESDLVADLDLDSVDFLALVAVLRERYGVRPDVAWVIKRMRGTPMRTFADLTAFIREVLLVARKGQTE